MRMKCLILILLLCLIYVPTLRAQDPAPAPPSKPMVGLSLLVTDKDGKGLTSIRKDEIRVFEDKTEQTILGLEADERPVDYVIVVDSTGSFVKLLQSAIDAAKLFILNRRPQDQVAIVRFVNSRTPSGETCHVVTPRAYYVGPKVPPAKPEDKKKKKKS